MKLRTLASAVLVLALAACAFGGGVNSLPGSSYDTPAVQNALGPSANATLLVTIAIPIVKTVADFTSPATQSLVIVEGKKTVGKFNTQKSSHGCKKKRSTLTCTFSVAVDTGKQIFSFKTYDQKNGKGALLAVSRVVKKIASGTNKIALTLKGVVHSIVVGLSEPQPLIGKSATIDVVVTVLDASGAVITGKYPAAIVLSDTDTSGATRLSATKVKSSSTAITLSYNGAHISAATINAKSKGVKAANIIPGSLRPSTVASLTISGTAALSMVGDALGNVAAYIPVTATSKSPGGVITVPVAKNGVIVDGVRAPRSLAPKALKLTPSPDECAPDLVHAQIYCMSFQSNIVNIVKYDPSDVLNPLTLVGSTTTDAPTSGVSISAGTCVICGIAYDPNDNAYIISTANGYELWPTTAGATTPIKTLPAPVSENFGYNAVTNKLFSAYYAEGTDKFDACGTNPYYYACGYSKGLDVIDIASTDRYVLASPPPMLSEPDAAAVDTKTNIGIAPEEFAEFASSSTIYPIVYLDNLNAPPSEYAAPTPLPSPLPSGIPAYTHGSYTSPVAIATPNSALIRTAEQNLCDLTYTAVDSVKDLGFFGEEFCGGADYIAVAQLPTTATGTLAISNYVAAEMPKTPNGAAFSSPYDPHAVLVINMPGICDDCGVLFNYDKSYLAMVDLNGLLALNPGGGEKDVPTTSTLKGIVTYFATGVSSPPSEFVRRLGAAAHRRHRHR